MFVCMYVFPYSIFAQISFYSHLGLLIFGRSSQRTIVIFNFLQHFCMHYFNVNLCLFRLLSRIARHQQYAKRRYVLVLQEEARGRGSWRMLDDFAQSFKVESRDL